MLPHIVLPFAAFLTAWWLTGRVRQYALARELLDVPNARSSHSVPTPRGGGIAIVFTTVAALVIMSTSGQLSRAPTMGLVASGILVAAIGFADDHRHMRRRWRLLGHFGAAALALASLGGLPPFHMLGAEFDGGWVGHLLALVYIVWVLNLTNFMDGIDGIAGVEAITVCVGGTLLYQLAVPGQSYSAAPLVLAAATLGFLVWNWPPAKIFMGDAGSGFLGLMIAALSLQAAWTAPELLWSWIILLGVFIVDATVTLARRALRGDRFYDPHRTHAYQHAAQRWGAHRAITVAVAVINVCWLLPIAWLVARRTLDSAAGVLLAYAPLVVAAVRLGAGVPQIDDAGREKG